MIINSGIAALLGAFIGAFAGVAGTWVQQRHLNRRELTKLAIEMAEKDFNNKLAEKKENGTEGEMAPIGAFFHYYHGVLNAINDDKCTPEWILSNSQGHGDIERAFREAKRQYENRSQADKA